MDVDAVVFDCDGVLVDSEPITLGVLTAMLNELGLAFTVEQTTRTFMGKALREELEIIERLAGRPVPAGWYDGFTVRRDVALARDVKAVPGIGHVLDALDAAGLPFAVASGASRSKMRVTLGATGLIGRFETDAARIVASSAGARGPHVVPGSRLFGADMVERAKPAPDVYLLAARALGVDPARCAVVEDTPTGTAAGVAAGATVLGYCAHTDPRDLLAAGAAAGFDDMHHLPVLLAR
ncbi:MAG TPA: HAD-IA family hydrolase [Burkholderiaceae bacterium]|nr:HAD-IA family hydrolase [Burkholderiaceae bacterium]